MRHFFACVNRFLTHSHLLFRMIRFPPRLWWHLADMFNGSSSPYLICYHSPTDIISKYGFNVRLVVQAPTSMHGSKEGHTGYIYKRNKRPSRTNLCDPFFKDAWATVKDGLEMLDQTIDSKMHETSTAGRLTRSHGVKHTAVSKIEEKEKAEEEAKKAKKMAFA